MFSFEKKCFIWSAIGGCSCVSEIQEVISKKLKDNGCTAKNDKTAVKYLFTAVFLFFIFAISFKKPWSSAD